MDFDAVLIPGRREQMVARGLWHGRTINDELDRCVAAHPDRLALISHRAESADKQRLSYRELATMADRIAVGLARLGLGRGDVVSCQLPNCWQFTALYLACSRIGVVFNPLMAIFRERELGFMLAHGCVKAIIAARQFRGFDYEQMLAGMRPALPDLEHVLIVGGAGADSFEARLTVPQWEREPDAEQILRSSRPGPDDVSQVVYTSGTTGEPKGVMHTANTLMANIVPYAARMQLSADDVVLMASPLAHQTGFLFGLMMPIVLGARAVLQDVWDPLVAVSLIRDEGATFTMASTPFLTDLAKAVDETGGVPTLRTFLCAGAPIPGPLVERARTSLGAKVVSAWGMTENGAVTTTLLDDDDERSIHTDGCPLPGMEVRALGADDKPLPADVEGRLQVRGASNFGGYLKRPQLNGTDAEGWFDTGDMARIDARGYLRICGRSKDVIIRGGENIPVVEIEALLYKHPSIVGVAIVAYPDERLGERACAFVTLRDGAQLSFEDMSEFLGAQKIAKQYIPERLEFRDALPATPSGKIQKFKLREMLEATVRR